MQITRQIATHLRGVFFGDNWTDVNLKDQLADVNWQEATTQVYDLNTIASLVYHMTYFVSGVLKVLQGGPLETKDALSFDLPPIRSQEDWVTLLEWVWAEAEQFAREIEKLPDSKMEEAFVDAKYGTYYANLHGIIEHCHYHLGQIVLIRKILKSDQKH